MTSRLRDALAILAAAKQPMSAAFFAKRFWTDRRVKNGHWQRAGSYLRKLATDGLVEVIYGAEYTDTFRISKTGREALAANVPAK